MGKKYNGMVLICVNESKRPYIMNLTDQICFNIVLAARAGEPEALIYSALSGYMDKVKPASTVAGATAIMGDDPKAGLLIIDITLLNAATPDEFTSFIALVQGRKIPVIIITGDTDDESGIKHTFKYEWLDTIKKTELPSLLDFKIRLFNQLYYYKGRLVEAIEEKKYITNQARHFIQVMAHDIKSPLSSSVFILSILKEEEKLEPETKEFVEQVYEANINFSDMITLAADHIQESMKEEKTELVDTDEMIREIIAGISSRLPVSFITEGQFPKMRTKKHKLRQAVEALLQDVAVHAGTDNKNITVGVQEKNHFYEFYVCYPRDMKMPDYKRTFLTRDKPVKVNNHESHIYLNTAKMLVQEQWGKLTTPPPTDNKSMIKFEWLK